MSWKTLVGGAVVLSLGILFLAAIVLAIAQLAVPIQTGTYTGQVIDYSHQRGIIFKTNDLTTKTHERSSAREDWCVPDDQPELVEKVRAIDEGDRIELEYSRPLWIWPDTCQGGLKVIDEIHVVNESA